MLGFLILFLFGFLKHVLENTVFIRVTAVLSHEAFRAKVSNVVAEHI